MSTPLRPRELVITQGTAGFPPFAEHAAATAAAGCRGISIWMREYSAALDAGAAPDELRRCLDELGLVCSDIDAYVAWAGTGEPAPDALRSAPLEPFLEAGQILGARHANIVISGDAGYEPGRGAEVFASVAEATRAAGLIPYLEFVPQPASPVDDVLAAWEVLRASGCPEAGLLIDTWHFTRGPSTLEMLDEIPLERVLGLQISDASARPVGDLLHETMHGRLLPGEGAAPLVPLLRRLDAGSCPAPCTIEIFSDAQRALDPREAVRRAVEATRRVLVEAAGSASDS